MPWQIYVFILDCPGYPMKGKYSRGNLNNIRNELRDTVAADGRFNDQIAAWIADGEIESRWYADENGSLPRSFMPYAAKIAGDIYHDIDFFEPNEFIAYAHWEERHGNEQIEQYTVLYVLTNAEIDTSIYEEV